MATLFGAPSPVRVVLTFNSWSGGERFDWDLVATNPETGDLLHMEAHPARRRPQLGPEIARALLGTQLLLSAELDQQGPPPAGPSSGLL